MADIGRIEQTADSEYPTITMVGEFDLSNAPDLVRRQLNASGLAAIFDIE